ncbi:MAG: C25 family cysteine peptidase, partial [Bacteroidales bacterium]|nr:C25 family cysteine peptidase [Bacteroidales bacterium]
MKKIFVLLAIIAFLLNSLFAQNKSAYQVTSNSLTTGLTVIFNTGKIEVTNVETDSGFFSHITIAGENYSSSTEIGKPELPVLVKLIEIPICNDLILTVNPLSSYHEYDASELGIHYPVFPAQPSYSKSYEGPVKLIKDASTYNTNQFYSPMPLGHIEKMGIKRNVNIAALYFSPVTYNPVTQKIRVYETVQFEVQYYKADIPATYQMKSLHNNGIFLSARNQLINAIEPLQKNTIATAPIKYLIVAHSMFRGQLDNFIAWKKRKGFLVEIAYTDDFGTGTTNTSIKNFIKARYDNATPENPAPTFVLLVGDVEQIPAFNNGTGHASDLPYMCWTADDNLPDCYYGRFSAQNISQLTPQIEKTLMYEQYTMPSTAYLNSAVLIAGTAGGGLNDNQKQINGQMNYLSSNYVNTAQGYANVHYYQYNCSNQAAAIRDKIGQGVGFANYSAHCSSAGWANPQFNTSQIANMQNQHKYGLMIGNCCQSSRFDISECFAEKLLRIPNKGAVGYIGGSDDTYWEEDYMWSVGAHSAFSEHPDYDATHLGAYDRLFHTHNETYSDWIATNGAIISAGNMAVQASTSTLKNYYWEIYHLMGDPSVMTYLSQPQPLVVSVNTTLLTGETTLDVHAVPYAYIALTGNSGTTLHATGFTNEEGDVTLTFG